MTIEAIDSILDHILDGFSHPDPGLGEDATPDTLDAMVDHLASGAFRRPDPPTRPVRSGTCLPVPSPGNRHPAL